jgi:hypothetical protein
VGLVGRHRRWSGDDGATQLAPLTPPSPIFFPPFFPLLPWRPPPFHRILERPSSRSGCRHLDPSLYGPDPVVGRPLACSCGRWSVVSSFYQGCSCSPFGAQREHSSTCNEDHLGRAACPHSRVLGPLVGSGVTPSQLHHRSRQARLLSTVRGGRSSAYGVAHLGRAGHSRSWAPHCRVRSTGSGAVPFITDFVKLDRSLCLAGC